MDTKSLRHQEIHVTPAGLRKLGWSNPNKADTTAVMQILRAAGFTAYTAEGVSGRFDVVQLEDFVNETAQLFDAVILAAAAASLNRQETAVLLTDNALVKARTACEQAARETEAAEQAEAAAITLLDQARQQPGGAELAHSLGQQVATAGNRAAAARRRLAEAAARLATAEAAAAACERPGAASLMSMWQALVKGVTGGNGG